MRKINEISIKGKRVLVRCDFNVSLDEKGKILSTLRLRQALPTINYLLKRNARVVLISHFKEPKEPISIHTKKRKRFSKGSILPVKKPLEKMMRKKIRFFPDCIGEKAVQEAKKIKEGEVLLLENTRIYKEEKENSLEMGKELSLLGDIFINDAFSVSHRFHASVTHIPSFLPSAGGMLMRKEVKVLDKIEKNSARPIVAIIGGAKVESKITAVRYFLENADHVLLGGKIANIMLIVRKIAFNSPWPSKKIVQAVKEMDYTSPKLHLPVDVIASPDSTGKKGTRETAPGKVKKEEDIFDIGEETVGLYEEIIKEAKTVIWAGPLGFSERKPFEQGTKNVGRIMTENKKALKVIGGGDTGKAFEYFGFLDKVDHISYGGGAMLTYLRKGPMPGIEALDK